MNKEELKKLNKALKRSQKGYYIDNPKSMALMKQDMKIIDKATAFYEDSKEFGKCESCGMETVLVEENMLCGPCCFGEADTINGNW